MAPCGYCCDESHTMAECEHPMKELLRARTLEYEQVDEHRVRVRFVPVIEDPRMPSNTIAAVGPGEIAVLTGLQEARNAQTEHYILDREPRGTFAQPIHPAPDTPLTADDVLDAAKYLLDRY
jgi:hypothetical protein